MDVDMQLTRKLHCKSCNKETTFQLLDIVRKRGTIRAWVCVECGKRGCKVKHEGVKFVVWREGNRWLYRIENGYRGNLDSKEEAERIAKLVIETKGKKAVRTNGETS